MDPQSSSTSVHASVVRGLREQGPLVQCLTNFVSMDLAANALSAAGASPAMVHDPEEAAEMAALAGAVCVNIGTPSPRWVEGMHAAAKAAHGGAVPWVLDPVAVGATSYRRDLVADLLVHRPAVVRANAGEVLALAGIAGGSRGVDSTASADDAVEAAVSLASTLDCVVVVSGAADVVTDGRRVLRVLGGHPWMPMITALGCTASALVAAACGVEVDGDRVDALDAAAAAMALLAAAGEQGARAASGPASLRVGLVDALAAADRLDLGDRVETVVA